MNSPLEVLQDVTTRLESQSVDYFLVGSLASMYYGQPRFTNDIDLVLVIRPTQLQNFLKLFPIDSYYCPPEEILRDEVLRNGSFNLIHQESQIKIDIDLLKPTEFYASELKRRKKVSLTANFQAFIASPEDIILKKLSFYKEGGSQKHLDDIRGILAETPIDEQYLKEWIPRFGVEEEWTKAQ